MRFENCACGCGRLIHLTNWDQGGADYAQPEGFYDESCQSWFRNECADRKRRMCEPCCAFAEADALVALAMSIRNNLSVGIENPKAAHDELRRMVGVEAPLGRRLRRMIAKAQKPTADSCDPKTCVECLRGAA